MSDFLNNGETSVYELTPAEIDSVSGGQGTTTAGAGIFDSVSGSAYLPEHFAVFGAFGSAVTIHFPTLAAGSAAT